MAEPYIPLHGPQHHFLDGAAFLTAYHNNGGAVDLSKALDELAKRALVDAARDVRLLGDVRGGGKPWGGLFDPSPSEPRFE
jgi:4-aminobutyrate aminotransferase-like enzyme